MPDKNKKKVLIVDDEVFISEQLNIILQGLDYEVTGMAYDTKSALDSLKLNPPDIAILDIKMHGENQGFKIADYIKKNMDIPFVFLTSFADESTVNKASELTPDGYLLKPFNERDIFSGLHMALNRYEKKAQFIDIKIGHEVHKVRLNDILWIQSSDKYIEIHSSDRRYLKRESIESFIEFINLPNIIRVHRSYAVNITQVDSVKSSSIFIDNEEIPISKSYHEAFIKAFQSI